MKIVAFVDIPTLRVRALIPLHPLLALQYTTAGRVLREAFEAVDNDLFEQVTWIQIPLVWKTFGKQSVHVADCSALQTILGKENPDLVLTFGIEPEAAMREINTWMVGQWLVLSCHHPLLPREGKDLKEFVRMVRDTCEKGEKKGVW